MESTNQPSCPLRVAMHSLLSISHSSIVSPKDPEAKSLPSGEKVKEHTISPSVAMHSLLSTSHSLIVLSSDPEAKRLPSGEKLTDFT